MAVTKMKKFDHGRESETLVYSVPEAGALLGLPRNGVYEAARTKVIPTIAIGKLLKVPKAAFHAKFGPARE